MSLCDFLGLKDELSELYVESALSIQDVTDLARRVGEAHSLKDKAKSQEAMVALLPLLPVERPYMPACTDAILKTLRLKTEGKEKG